MNTDKQIDKESVQGKEAEVKSLREQVSRLQRVASKETNLAVAQNLMSEAAVLNRRLSKLMDELGLAALASRRKGKPMTERDVAFHLPTKEMSPADLMKLVLAGNVTDAGAVALRDLHVSGEARRIVLPWQAPMMPGFPTVQDVAAFMAAAKSYRALAPVQRCEKDPNFKKGGGLANFATVTQQAQFVSQDGEWISGLQQWPTVSVTDEFKDRVRELLREAVQTYYVGSGPIQGWYARILAGDARPRPKFELTVEEEAQVFAALPWDPAKVYKLREMTLVQALALAKVNPAAGAGFPRQKKKGLCIKEVMADAADYHERMAAKTFNKYASENPGEFLTEVKNKHDRYEIADMGKKIRPYYNVNGGLAVLYSVTMRNYAGALKGFWEDPHSCNAHGLAWNGGGGQRLYNWVMWAHQQPAGLYAIGYSDDGLWVLRTSEGRTLISDKDVAQMDQSCGQGHRKTFQTHASLVCKDDGPGWSSIRQAAINGVWTQIVVLHKALTYLSTDKIHSGAVGTSEADQIGFATAFVLLRANLHSAKEYSIEQFEKAEAALAQRTGLRFKPSPWTEFAPDQEEYPWMFLGKKLARFRGMYVPIVPLDKAIVQLVTPKRNDGGKMGQCAWMERARGLALTTLWWYPELFELARVLYIQKQKLGHKPKPTMDGAETGDRDEDHILGQGLVIDYGDDERFPERSYIIDFYLGTSKLAPDTPPTQRLSLPTAQVPTAADVFGEIFGDDQAHLQWGDRDPVVEEARYQGNTRIGDGQRLKPAEVVQVNPGPAQWQISPLSQAVKDAYLKKLIAARAEIKAANPALAGKLKKGGALEAILEGQVETLVFTKKGIERAIEDAVEEDLDWVDDYQWYEAEAMQEELEEKAYQARESVLEKKMEDLYQRVTRRAADQAGRGNLAF